MTTAQTSQMNFSQRNCALALNNPGRLGHSLIAWEGRVASPKPHPHYLEFIDAVAGLRALAKLLLSFRHQPESKPLTMGSLAERWLGQQMQRRAGARESKRQLVKLLQVGLNLAEDRVIDLTEPATLFAVVQVILLFEHGHNPYRLPQIAEGVKRAISSIEEQDRRQRKADYLAAQAANFTTDAEPPPAKSLKGEKMALRQAAEALFVKNNAAVAVG